MDFKGMTGNEVLINLQHVENMTTGEMLNCLHALSKHDRRNEYPWVEHPWFSQAMKLYKTRVARMGFKHSI
jgi:hypothetical protein